MFERLLERAREGRSATLLIRGDAGVGKSALLSYVTERAGGFTVLTARGVESETELSFAGLADLLRPLLLSCRTSHPCRRRHCAVRSRWGRP